MKQADLIAQSEACSERVYERPHSALTNHYIFFGEPGGVLKLGGDCGNEEQWSHASDEHDYADDVFPDKGELARESHRKSACGIGAHDFEENLEERPVICVMGSGRDFCTKQNQCRGRDDDYGDDDNSNRFIDGVVRNGASEYLSLFSAEEPVDAEQPDDRSGCNLDAAAATTGVCADEHDDDKEKERGLREVGNVDGIEPCSAARERHEQYGLRVLAKSMAAEEVVPFGEREHDDACEDDDDGAVSRDAGVQRNAPYFFMRKVEDISQFRDGQKAESACKHENAGGDVHDGVVLVAFERVGEQRKSYAAERTHCLEQRAENAVVGFHGFKLREIDDAANQFQDKRKRNYCLEDAACVDVSFLREFRKENGLVAESRMHAGKQDNRRGCGHDAETAQLHERNKDPQSGVRKRGSNIDNGKPRDADGGHGGKECFDKVNGARGGLRQT